jgi:putative membrane-bound dehydrogenase-like protein
MNHRLASFLFCIGAFLWLVPPAAAQVQGLKVPPGFEVTEFADHTLANDIYCMTVDPRGRIVVSGRGYIKILVDDKETGKATRAIDFADTPKDGAMGLLWEDDSLYVTGDGGLRRFKTKDGDHAAGPSELLRKMKTGGEHEAHALRRGPDGWLYLLCGNVTGINKSYAELPTSPVTDPIAGCVLRFTPDLQECEIVADGFRNPYGMDFNSDGELFTWDSDNERCVSLPWYEGTRFYHVIPGGNYGWMAPQRAATWRRPPYFFDVVPPILDMGRGSPTGVACYRHVQFPEKYRGGFFCCDWTFGKVWFLKLRPSGASYEATKELFLESLGDNGFAPTACVVHPETGDLFISIGGRGTRGAVYRIRYSDGVKGASAAAAAKLQPAPRSLDMTAKEKPHWLAEAASKNAQRRLKALQMIWRHQKMFSDEERLQAINPGWATPDRFRCLAAAELMRTLPKKHREELLLSIQASGWDRIALLYAMVDRQPAKVVRVVLGSGRDIDDQAIRLAQLRLLQLALGDIGDPKLHGTVWEGYSARLSHKEIDARLDAKLQDNMERWLAKQMTTGPKATETGPYAREVTRTWALLGDRKTGVREEYALESRLLDGEPPLDTIHDLIVLARLGGCAVKDQPEGVVLLKLIASPLLGLAPKLDEQNQARDRNWPLRVGELSAELVRIHPKLVQRLVGNPNFGHPDHVLFAGLHNFDRKAAAAIFLRKAVDPQYRWNAAIIELIGELPDDEALPVMRKLWGKAGVDSAILPILARKPQTEDRAKFLAGLAAPQLETIRVCVEALRKLPVQKDSKETLALLQALGNLPQSKAAGPLREAIVAQLTATTGEKLGADREAWLKWFSKVEPKLAAKLTNPDGVDVESWKQRLDRLDWSRGDAGRGKTAFIKASCATCHSGSQALGPDLSGVGGRFSRDDLFTAILQPSRDVAERYRTTVIETDTGKIYQGVVIYEAVDGVILHTGAATTVRIGGKEIASRHISRISLMPAGLLDNLLDQEIADLYAYLKSLGARTEPAKK